MTGQHQMVLTRIDPLQEYRDSSLVLRTGGKLAHWLFDHSFPPFIERLNDLPWEVEYIDRAYVSFGGRLLLDDALPCAPLFSLCLPNETLYMYPFDYIAVCDTARTEEYIVRVHTKKDI